MKIVYLGTPYFAASLLEMLLSQRDLLEVAAVITQPDQPVGRKKVPTPSPVKETALKNGIPVSYSLQTIEEVQPDLAILFAYGEIIPHKVLSIPKYGFWNVHPSLLPLFRGASPITYPLFLNEEHTGVTLMQMDRDLDHGPIIGQVLYRIQKSDTRGFLEKHFTEMAFLLFKKHFIELQANGSVLCQEQTHSKATFTRPLSRDDGFIPKSLLSKALKGEKALLEDAPALVVEYLTKHNELETFSSRYDSASKIVWSMNRALHDWPGLWTKVLIENRELRLKLLDFSYTNEKLAMTRVQLEGKNPVDFASFQKAYALF